MPRRTVVTPRIGPDGIVVSVTEEEAEDGQGVPCPFHGMVGHPLGSISGGPCGNACALEMAHAPCPMEMAGHVPHWDACKTWNVAAEAEEVCRVVELFAAFPDSERPPGIDSWEGIPVKEWFSRVMGRPWRGKHEFPLAPARDVLHPDP